MKVTRSFFKARYFYSQIRRLLLKTRQLLMKSEVHPKSWTKN